MMVARERRGQGIGGRLLDDSLRWGRESGLHKVDLGVWPHNAAAIALYRSRGFTVEGRLRRHFRRANGELWDVVTMGIVLDTQSPGSSYPDAEISVGAGSGDVPCVVAARPTSSSTLAG